MDIGKRWGEMRGGYRKKWGKMRDGYRKKNGRRWGMGMRKRMGKDGGWI